MKDKKYILFDLDGTIMDPREGIAKSCRHVLKHFGMDDADSATLDLLIGPPLRVGLRDILGVGSEYLEEAVSVYREYYGSKGIFECYVFPGIEDLLKELGDAGKTSILATSKAAVYAETILDHFGLRGYFAFVSGSELDGSRSDKFEVIQYAVQNMDIRNLEAAVMVGDRKMDIIGARKANMDSIGVLYGNGSREELEEAVPSAIAGDVNELSRLLLK